MAFGHNGACPERSHRSPGEAVGDEREPDEWLESYLRQGKGLVPVSATQGQVDDLILEFTG